LSIAARSESCSRKGSLNNKGVNRQDVEVKRKVDETGRAGTTKKASIMVESCIN